jgi:hypothetical protein
VADTVQLHKLEVLLGGYVQDEADADDYGSLEVCWVSTEVGLHFSLLALFLPIPRSINSM